MLQCVAVCCNVLQCVAVDRARKRECFLNISVCGSLLRSLDT